MGRKIQRQDIKDEAELITDGTTAQDGLPNDVRIWVEGASINKTLFDALEDGDIVTTPSTPYALDIQEEGVDVVSNPTDINFVGDNVTVTESPAGVARVEIISGGGGGTLEQIEYGEALTEGDPIEVYDDGGTRKVRKIDTPVSSTPTSICPYRVSTIATVSIPNSNQIVSFYYQQGSVLEYSVGRIQRDGTILWSYTDILDSFNPSPGNLAACYNETTGTILLAVEGGRCTQCLLQGDKLRNGASHVYDSSSLNPEVYSIPGSEHF